MRRGVDAPLGRIDGRSRARGASPPPPGALWPRTTLSAAEFKSFVRHSRLSSALPPSFSASLSLRVGMLAEEAGCRSPSHAIFPLSIVAFVSTRLLLTLSFPPRFVHRSKKKERKKTDCDEALSTCECKGKRGSAEGREEEKSGANEVAKAAGKEGAAGSDHEESERMRQLERAARRRGRGADWRGGDLAEEGRGNERASDRQGRKDR